MSAKIGFVGLGKMGRPMAERILRRGYNISVWNRTGTACDFLKEMGAKVAISLQDLACRSDVIITMVFDDRALEAVSLTENGLLEGISENKVLVDMSTVSPKTSAKISAAVKKKGGRMLRAPVLGSVQAAENGELKILVSGDETIYQGCTELFAILGQKTLYVGKGEKARSLKLLHNIMVGISNQMMAEALVFGRKTGLEWDVMCEMMKDSFVTSPLLTFKLEILSRRIKKGQELVASSTSLLAKDLDMALGIAQERDLPLPLTALVRQFLSILKASGRDAADFSYLFFLLEELAGIKS